MIVSTAPAQLATSLDLAAAALRSGALLGLPTETVYGLAADADQPQAVAQIFSSKGRPADHPLIVHVAALDGGHSGVDHYCERVPDFARALMDAFWPGPLTLILPRRAGVADAAAGGQASVGVRCPAHPVAMALLERLRQPASPEVGGATQIVWGLAAPSANRFGRVSPTTAAHVASELGDRLLVLDGGACDVGIESTIIDCTRGEPVLLRPGAITPEQVLQACGRKLLSNQELDQQQGRALQPSLAAPKASGTLESHYAPRATVRLMDAQQLAQALDMLQHGKPTKTAPDQPARIALYHRSPLKFPAALVSSYRMPSSAAAAAHELFARLRAMDDTGVGLIWVEAPPAGSDWDGVRDRLQRAAA
ncbi:threonylcarbamoyl-AMP synthase [Curvibacter sp. CHRR-16]|uniref:L-threonylcarbamoyladenylate synthase n=1 Tax=Curvibacter sp. CHRR-16 TaxID=2835872 RepID=UPI001BDACC08|nr:L-threonylcarbamoyladenylate synthase [Curvibacter sp. CHRR-16]MBT0570035.1 threonylcarbamoyl-AMP synthase [Curvibacter sp. CHRR-16]